MRILPRILHTALRLPLARRVMVRGWSMYPTLSPGEYVLFDRLAYRWAMPQKGDVVLATHPMDVRFLMIKRVLAVPGEVVQARGRELLIDGEPWTPIVARNSSRASLHGDFSFELREGEYFVMGDDPARSTDSRQLGPFARSAIKAKGYLVYWPPSHRRSL